MVNICAVEWSSPCGCVMVYQYDRDITPPVHTCIAIRNKCSDHPPSVNITLQQHHDSVLAEHQKVQWSLGNALSLLAAQIGTTDPDSGAIVLKPGITFNYNFSGSFPNRTCTVSFTGVTLTANQKNTLQNKLNQIFGAAGLVTVQ